MRIVIDPGTGVIVQFAGHDIRVHGQAESRIGAAMFNDGIDGLKKGQSAKGFAGLRLEKGPAIRRICGA